MSDVWILGIHDGHNCGASLSCGPRVIASVQEERLTRRKNEAGYPERAIADCLRIAGIDASDLAAVAYASNFMHDRDHLLDLEPWYLVGIEDQRRDFATRSDYNRIIFEERRRQRIDDVTRHLGVPADKVSFVEHHRAHLTAAYYTAPNVAPGDRVLGLTCDGAGDGLCATVSVCEGTRIDRIAETDRHASIGKIYSRMTMLMGMKPWEHEYKLMGLAPYADLQRADRAAEALRQLVRLREDGLGFELAGELSTNYSYYYLREAFERVRFDTMAAAVQLFTEQLLVEWVRTCIAKTGLDTLVCGGGVFMNVKANMLLAALPEVRSLYVMPSASDESLSIGACLDTYFQSYAGSRDDAVTIDNLYLGGQNPETDETAALRTRLNGAPVEVTEPRDMDIAIADRLALGDIIAVCRGRMEWGARALGNRSILAPAEDFRVVDTINEMIKKRDFWMPFAPSIREDDAGRYLEDPKDLHPWFMTLAYPARDAGYRDLMAAAHPRDRTIRPQLVTERANAPYHRMLSAFAERTGKGVVLNTSFNLHGEPIVYSADDAIRVLLASGLEWLALDRHLIQKTGATDQPH